MDKCFENIAIESKADVNKYNIVKYLSFREGFYFLHEILLFSALKQKEMEGYEKIFKGTNFRARV